MGRDNKFSLPPPQSFRCGPKWLYTLSHPEAWLAPFMTHDWSPSNVTDSAGQGSQSTKRNALTRLLEWILLLTLSQDIKREELSHHSFFVKIYLGTGIIACLHSWQGKTSAPPLIMRTSLPNLEHWMPLECGETSRQTAHPTLHWWQQQYAAGRWCRAAGFPGGTVFSLQGAPPERLCSLHWYDRTSGRQWLSHDSAYLEGAAKRPGCPLDCGWSGWALGHGEELQVDKTAGIRMKECVKANEIT